jgi:hypothetical protein
MFGGHVRSIHKFNLVSLFRFLSAIPLSFITMAILSYYIGEGVINEYKCKFYNIEEVAQRLKYCKHSLGEQIGENKKSFFDKDAVVIFLFLFRITTCTHHSFATN